MATEDNNVKYFSVYKKGKDHHYHLSDPWLHWRTTKIGRDNVAREGRFPCIRVPMIKRPAFAQSRRKELHDFPLKPVWVHFEGFKMRFCSPNAHNFSQIWIFNDVKQESHLFYKDADGFPAGRSHLSKGPAWVSWANRRRCAINYAILNCFRFQGLYANYFMKEAFLMGE